jgi:NAD+ synthase
MQYSFDILPEKAAPFIVDWLQSYAKKSGMLGFVVGISGGIDSALTSTLVAETGLPVWALDLPIHQETTQLSRAREHIAWLEERYTNVQAKTIDLTEVFNAFKSITVAGDSPQELLALANSRSRLRMLTLYQMAQTHSALVVGTGNKVEDFGIGFYTKYGDGGVDISPIADLMKSEVYAIAKFLKINKNIIEATPTDGLWDDNRSDEDQIGATYNQMEWAMHELELKKEESDYTSSQLKVIQLFKGHHKRNLHKMTPIPVCEIPQNFRVSRNI